MELAAGTVLKEQIVLERELGRGGMGVVWAAKHRGLDASVAVKVLHAEALQSDEARARFDREAKAIARIDSPHVVRIFDIGVTDEGCPFIVMELLRGRDLKTQLAERGPLGLEETALMIRQLCAALGRAHEIGIIHRDIKPANVFLADGGAGLFAKVLDFGIAKIASHGGLQLTATESLVGTPYYMSPEQFIDARTIDLRSDLWSVAVVAYASLTSTLPFLGESVGALALEVHRGDFRPPSAHCAGLPASIDHWFRRALDPKPENRFQTAAELAETFAEAARGASPHSSPAPNASPGLQDVMQPASPLAASPSFAASTEVTASPPPKPRRAVVALVAAALVAAGAVAAAFAVAGSGNSPPTVSTTGEPTGTSAPQPPAPAAPSLAIESLAIESIVARGSAEAPIAASAGSSIMASASAPVSISAARSSAPAPAAAGGPPPGYRPRKQVCNKGQGFCNNCCQPGDLLGKYPDCQCYWKPPQTGVPAGARRTGTKCNAGTDFCNNCCQKGEFLSHFPDCACYWTPP